MTSSWPVLDRTGCVEILSRYELFKLTLEVPGDIAECGVFKGSGLYTWVKLMLLFKPNNEYRVHGFDFFETDRTATFQYQTDRDVLDEHQDGWTRQEDLLGTCGGWGFDRLKLHAGNVIETTKQFTETELGARLSLLYIDVDNYEGALACLKTYTLLVSGGVVALDEYALPGYVVNQMQWMNFFTRKNVKLKAIPGRIHLTAYVIKEI